MSAFAFAATGSITVSKLAAARRQLDTAIELWFADGDLVSVHALAFAAYEVIHFVSKHRNPNRRDLIFDSRIIKDEWRKLWNDRMKKEANFFKHADRDPDAIIELHNSTPEFFILFAIVGLCFCKEPPNELEEIFNFWFYLHHPDLLTEYGRKLVQDGINIDGLNGIRNYTKCQFLHEFREARRRVSLRHARSQSVVLGVLDPAHGFVPRS